MMPYFVVYTFHFGYFVRGPLALQVFADSCQARVSWSVLLFDQRVVGRFLLTSCEVFSTNDLAYFCPQSDSQREARFAIFVPHESQFFEDKESAATAKK